MFTGTWVLILVLVEYTVTLNNTLTTNKEKGVLILVLVEYTVTMSIPKYKWSSIPS